jgi:hypothetical protein
MNRLSDKMNAVTLCCPCAATAHVELFRKSYSKARHACNYAVTSTVGLGCSLDTA